MASLTSYNTMNRNTIADGDKLAFNISACSANDEAILSDINAVSSTIDSVYNTVKQHSATDWANSAIVAFSSVVIHQNGDETELMGATGPAFNKTFYIAADPDISVDVDVSNKKITLKEDSTSTEDVYKHSYMYYSRDLQNEVRQNFPYSQDAVFLTTNDREFSNYNHRTNSAVTFEGGLGASFMFVGIPYDRQNGSTPTTAFVNAQNSAFGILTDCNGGSNSAVKFHIDNSIDFEARPQGFDDGDYPIETSSISIFREYTPCYTLDKSIHIKGGASACDCSILLSEHNTTYAVHSAVSLLPVTPSDVNNTYVLNKSQNYLESISVSAGIDCFVNNKSISLYTPPKSASDCSIVIDYCSQVMNVHTYVVASAIALGTYNNSYSAGEDGAIDYIHYSNTPHFNQNLNIGFLYNRWNSLNAGIPYNYNDITDSDLKSTHGKCISLQGAYTVDATRSIFLKGGFAGHYDVQDSILVSVDGYDVNDTHYCDLTHGVYKSILHNTYNENAADLNAGAFSAVLAANATVIGGNNCIFVNVSGAPRPATDCIICDSTVAYNSKLTKNILLLDSGSHGNETGSERNNFIVVGGSMTLDNSNTASNVILVNSDVRQKVSSKYENNCYITTKYGYNFIDNEFEPADVSKAEYEFCVSSNVYSNNKVEEHRNNIILNSNIDNMYKNSLLYNVSSMSTGYNSSSCTIEMNAKSYHYLLPSRSAPRTDMVLFYTSNTVNTDHRNYVFKHNMYNRREYSCYNALSLWNDEFVLDNEGYMNYTKFEKYDETVAELSYSAQNTRAANNFVGNTYYFNPTASQNTSRYTFLVM